MKELLIRLEVYCIVIANEITQVHVASLWKRFNFVLSSLWIRYEFDMKSFPYRIHIEFISSSHRIHIEFIAKENASYKQGKCEY